MSPPKKHTGCPNSQSHVGSKEHDDGPPEIPYCNGPWTRPEGQVPSGRPVGSAAAPWKASVHPQSVATGQSGEIFRNSSREFRNSSGEFRNSSNTFLALYCSFWLGSAPPKPLPRN